MIELTQELTNHLHHLENAFLNNGYTNEYALLAVFRCVMIKDIHNMELQNASQQTFV